VEVAMPAKKRLKLGVLVTSLSTNYVHEFCLGIENAARDSNTDIYFFSNLNNEDTFMLLENKIYYDSHTGVFEISSFTDIDAFILPIGIISHYLTDQKIPNKSFLDLFSGKPYIIIEDKIEGERCITVDNRKGFYDLISHLIEDHGYSHIGYVSGKIGNFDSEQRLDVFKECLKAHSIPFEDRLFTIGQFSGTCDKEISDLIDRNPDMQAIVCANDNMATVAYRQIKQRGLTVGVDMAVTGFDDIPIARLMDPPLTTVRVDTYSLGYTAVLELLALINSKNQGITNIPSKFIERSSCGVNSESTEIYTDEVLFTGSDDHSYAEYIADSLTGLIITRQGSVHIRRMIYDDVLPFTEFIVNQCFGDNINDSVIKNNDIMQEKLRRIINGPSSKYISPDNLQIAVNKLFGVLYKKADNKRKDHVFELMNEINLFISHSYFNSISHETNEFRISTHISNYIARNTIVLKKYSNKCFIEIMSNIQALGFKSCYLYLFDSNVVKKPGKMCVPPKYFDLKCYFDSNKIHVYSDKKNLVPRDQIFSSHLFNSSEARSYIVLGLSIRGEQQGIIVFECGLSQYDNCELANMQVSTTVKYLHLLRRKNAIEETLRKNNKVLTKQSTLDELTGVYNRRGFLTESNIQIELRRNQEAVAVFCDIDNLKQINDIFGHTEGDFAIRTEAEILRSSFRSHDIIGRVGGDEFAVLCFAENGLLPIEKITERIRNITDSFNSNSSKPYYVEFSFGFISFNCSSNLNFNDILSEADEKLYIDKKNKRNSVMK
jgi:diguanylate cyclase (GGDEF)-like protein